jgi:transcription elongation GreA/GreB family factor
MQALHVEHAGVATLRAEAMTQSSETWHDNAPADATLHEFGRIAAAGKNLIELAGRGLQADPDPNAHSVQIGSLATVHIWGETVGVAVVGSPLLYDEREFTDLTPLAEIVVVGPDSPLGKSLIGQMPNAEASYSTEEGRDFSYTVLAVDNELIIKSFSTKQENIVND